jgi:hypothetical protein
MRALPFLQCDFLPKEELHQFEYSDKLMISSKLFETLGTTTGPLILKITNPRGGFVAGTLVNLHTNDDIIYMPSWMITTLNITNNLTVSVLERIMCNRICMRPHNADFFSIPDWNTKFSEAIKLYNTFTIGNRVPIIIDKIFMFVTIEILNDRKYSTYFLQTGVDIDLEILTPLETKKEIVDIPYLYRSGTPVPTPTVFYAFSGTSHVLGGNQTDSNLSCSEQRAAAALARLKN